jgi:class 3 adenylate cyclase
MAESPNFWPVPGDRVKVMDPALAELRATMAAATHEEPVPNHHGTVESVDGDRILIVFDDGGSAPYQRNEVRPLEGWDDA